MRRRVAMATTGAALLALLILPGPAGAAGEQAGGTLVDAAGNPVGAVQLVQTPEGVVVAVTLAGAGVVRPGAHGIHFHTVGRCDGPDFATAGGHFNPAARQHGLQNPAGPHAGDLPNLVVGPGTATGAGYVYQAATTLATLAPGAASLFDADGAALVIHASPDDERSDPAGNSGGRVACAVLVPGGGAGTSPSPLVRALFQLRRLGAG